MKIGVISKKRNSLKADKKKVMKVMFENTSNDIIIIFSFEYLVL